MTLEIDYATSTATAHLNGERGKIQGSKVIITDDLVWKAAVPTTIKTIILTGNIRVRDRRWLWLRRKTVAIPRHRQPIDLVLRSGR